MLAWRRAIRFGDAARVGVLGRGLSSTRDRRLAVSGARSARSSAQTAGFMPPRRVSGWSGSPAACSVVSTRPAGPLRSESG
jgi:hypothetical protein